MLGYVVVMNVALSDVLFYCELADFIGFKRVHTSHLVSASCVSADPLLVLKDWQVKYADKKFPLPFMLFGRCRVWRKSDVLDWCIDNSPKYYSRVSRELKRLSQ